MVVPTHCSLRSWGSLCALQVMLVEEEGDAMTGEPREYSIATIRELLLAAFSAETLPRFLRDRRDFRPVLAQFSRSHGLDDMVAEVIDYCQTHLLWDKLLAEVRQANPRQYARFEDRLYEEPDRVAPSPPGPVPGRTKWPWQDPKPAWFWPAVGGAAVVIAVILVLIVWLPDPGPDPTPTPPLSTEAPVTEEPEPTEELVLVPNMWGELCSWAAEKFEDSDLRLGGELWEANSEVSYPRVIRTDPPAGVQVQRSSDVTVVCSLGPRRPVPNVAGKDVEDARYDLESCSPEPCFETKLAYEARTDTTEGSVIRTEPPGGAVVEPGSEVTLYVAAAPDPVEVPDVANLTLEEASEQLAASYLIAGEVVTETSQAVKAGRIIRSDPSSGEMVDAGSDVILVVSSGVGSVLVPDLIDRTWAAARGELERLGLQAVKGDERFHDDILAGNVIETDPSARESVVPGSEIKLVLSLGLDPEGDRDNDGMPNGWEAEHRLDPNTNDALLDPDRDKLPNLTEYEHKTNPWDADFPSIRVGLYYREERLLLEAGIVPTITVVPSFQDFPVIYDVEVGEATVFNVPAGEYRIGAEIDMDGNGYPCAGDLRSSERKRFTVSSEHQTVRGNIDLVGILHLTEPVDNAFALPRYDFGTFDLYSRHELLFQWDRVPGAASYVITIGEYQYEPTRVYVRNIVNHRTEETSYRPDLPPSSDGHYYNFYVSARTSGEAILDGLYVEHYISPGVTGVGYQFRVQ